MQIINTEQSKHLLAEISKFLREGHQVKVTGLGIFQLKDRKERQGRNPKTGETITIPAGKKFAFRFSSIFKRIVLG